MKLIVMVPCYNEEATLPDVIETIPMHIPGVNIIETLIVDDGSTDATIDVARRIGVNHIVRMKQNVGLARAFSAGIDTCLDLGADVIVNTDGDNQYWSQDIPKLIKPILTGDADVVIGDRQTHTSAEFSFTKKALQRLGSWAVRKLSGVPTLGDAVSGFRAYSRYSASLVYVVNSYSYTTETIIQAGRRRLRVVSVAVGTNAKTRSSRLYSSLPRFILRSGTTMLRSYALYAPLRAFLTLSSLAFLAGLGLGSRFVYFLVIGQSGGHIQSLILAAILLIAAALFLALGILADLLSTNRRLLEELVWREKASRRGLLDATFGVGEVSYEHSAPSFLDRAPEAGQEPTVIQPPRLIPK